MALEHWHFLCILLARQVRRPAQGEEEAAKSQYRGGRCREGRIGTVFIHQAGTGLGTHLTSLSPYYVACYPQVVVQPNKGTQANIILNSNSVQQIAQVKLKLMKSEVNEGVA